MAIIYESDEDRKRADALYRERARHFLNVKFTGFLAMCGAALTAGGFYQTNETYKNIGWAALSGGLVGVVYHYYKGTKLGKELHKPENSQVILQGKPISPMENKVREQAESMGLIKPAIQGEPVSPGTEIVQGRKAWETRMAEQQAQTVEKGRMNT